MAKPILAAAPQGVEQRWIGVSKKVRPVISHRIVAAPNALPPSAKDQSPRVYDPRIARNLWRALVQIQRVFTPIPLALARKVQPDPFLWSVISARRRTSAARRRPDSIR